MRGVGFRMSARLFRRIRPNSPAYNQRRDFRSSDFARRIEKSWGNFSAADN